MPAAGETLLDVLAEVRIGNDRPFLLDADGAVLLTYDGAARRSARLAHALRDRGLQPGDRLAMQVAKRVDALMMYLACIRAGVVLLPMNTGYTAAEVAHLVADAEPRLVVDDAVLDELAAAADGADAPRDELADHPSGPDDLAAILYTSGTTGRPKGAMLSHRNLASNTVTLAHLWGFTGDDVLLHALPIFHTHGLFVATNCCLVAGASMVFLERFEPDPVLAALDRCTVMMGVPTFYTRLLGDPRFELVHRDAPVHQRFGTAAGQHAHRVRGAHRAPDPRAVRDDRDDDAHLQPARRRPSSRHRGPAPAWDRGAGGGRRRSAARHR
jgi:malonyl-CoA/methylmalonyl-CoA synthetase